MKNIFKSTLAVAAATAAVAGTIAAPMTASAYNPRPTYSLQYINETGLGNTPVFNSIVYAGDKENRTGGDFDWYKATHKDENGNPMEVPRGTILDERNYVGARENTGINAGVNNVWEPNQIKVEEGKEYLVRIYLHNNNQNKEAVAKDVTVAFNTPTAYRVGSTSINGYIYSSNAGEYVDYVDFVNDSGIPFRMTYVEGSARLESNADFTKVTNADGTTGFKLSDEIVNAKNHGTKVGNALVNGQPNGEVPGCYDYAEYVTIVVRADFNRDYTIEKQVRLEGESEWKKTVEAKVGDRVEFQIQYHNTSNLTQKDVAIKDILPSNLQFVPGSIYFRHADENGKAVTEHVLGDSLVNSGLQIGNYTANSNAYLMFTAEVVDSNLGCGSNTLVNWAQAGVGNNVIQDYARVHLTKTCPVDPDDPVVPVTPVDPDTPNKLPTTGPEAIVGGVIATGALVTAAGYYIASRRQLRR